VRRIGPAAARYERAALTLNFVRALVEGGFAICTSGYWIWVSCTGVAQGRLSAHRELHRRCVDFFEGISGRQVHEATLVDF